MMSFERTVKSSSITTTKIVIRNYEGKIFEYPETGADPAIQFAPQREYHDEYLYS